MPIIKCKICGKEKFYLPSVIKKGKGKYCSRECYEKTLKNKRPKRKTGKIIKCQNCGKEFYIIKAVFHTKKYCSIKCRIASMKGQIAWNKGIKRKYNNALEIWRENGGTNKGKTNWNKGGHLSQEWKDKIRKSNKGKIVSDETREKLSKALTGKFTGKNNHNWKGDDVGYYALHTWVKKHLGRPTKCEHCGKDGLTGHQIQWANKDHKYRRNLDDWMRLCVKCHRKYDIKNNNYKQ